MIKICWITADSFYDSDFQIVPYLKNNNLDIKIDWFVVKKCFNKSEIKNDCILKTFSLRYKAKDPRIIFDYSTILKKIKPGSYDVVYSDYLGVPFYYFVLKFYTKHKPIIHVAHNVIPYDGWPNKRLMTWYLNYVFKHNLHFHIFSKHLVPYFTEHYKNKNVLQCPFVVKSYGNASTNNYDIDPSKLNLLFFGNVKANKRLDILIQAIKNIPKELQTRIHLTIAGKCDDVERYTSLIAGCNCISAYFKRIDDTEIAELFTKHQYLMLPYENVAQSGPHMIAYYYNLPVIASNIEGFMENVIDKENGFLFEKNNVESLTDVIKKVVTLPKADYDLIKRNLAVFVNKNYGFDSVSSRYVDFFKEIAKC